MQDLIDTGTKLAADFNAHPEWWRASVVAVWLTLMGLTAYVVVFALRDEGIIKAGRAKFVGLVVLLAAFAPVLWLLMLGLWLHFVFGAPARWCARKLRRKTKTVSGETIELQVSINVNQINDAATTTGAADIDIEVEPAPRHPALSEPWTRRKSAESEPMLTPVKGEYEAGDRVIDLLGSKGIGTVHRRTEGGNYVVRFGECCKTLRMADQLRPADDECKALDPGDRVIDASKFDCGPGTVVEWRVHNGIYGYRVRFDCDGAEVVRRPHELKLPQHVEYVPDRTEPYSGSKLDPLDAPAAKRDIGELTSAVRDVINPPEINEPIRKVSDSKGFIDEFDPFARGHKPPETKHPGIWGMETRKGSDRLKPDAYQCPKCGVTNCESSFNFHHCRNCDELWDDRNGRQFTVDSLRIKPKRDPLVDPEQGDEVMPNGGSYEWHVLGILRGYIIVEHGPPRCRHVQGLTLTVWQERVKDGRIIFAAP